MYDEYPYRSGIFDAMLFGYARVSTAEQNPDHQIDALVRAGVAAKDIYVDRASGAKASRPELDTVLRMLGMATRSRSHGSTASAAQSCTS